MANTTELIEELDPEAVRIGATIRSLRDAYGMSLVELGRRVDRTHGYLSKVERGIKKAPIALCRAIAEALGVPLHAIVSPAAEQTTKAS